MIWLCFIPILLVTAASELQPSPLIRGTVIIMLVKVCTQLQIGRFVAYFRARVIPRSRNYKGNRYKLSSQRFLGWTSFNFYFSDELQARLLAAVRKMSPRSRPDPIGWQLSRISFSVQPTSKLSGALWRWGGKGKEILQLRLWNLIICIEKSDAKCCLAEMTLVMASLPLARIFQCLFTFACFRFALIGGNLTVDGEPQGNWRRNSNSRNVVASSLSFSRPAARTPWRACSQARSQKENNIGDSCNGSSGCGIVVERRRNARSVSAPLSRPFSMN